MLRTLAILCGLACSLTGCALWQAGEDITEGTLRRPSSLDYDSYDRTALDVGTTADANAFRSARGDTNPDEDPVDRRLWSGEAWKINHSLGGTDRP